MPGNIIKPKGLFEGLNEDDIVAWSGNPCTERLIRQLKSAVSDCMEWTVNLSRDATAQPDERVARLSRSYGQSMKAYESIIDMIREALAEEGYDNATEL